MIPLCILFLHHNENALTRHHYALIKQFHPATPVVPLTFNLGLTEAITLSVSFPKEQDRPEWRNVDRLIYKWFMSDVKIEAERYLILEGDALCSMPAIEFYSEVWDKPASGAQIRTLKTNPKLWVLREVKHPEIYNGCLQALTPICGIMLSHDALTAIVTLSQDPNYDCLFSEVRIGTLLAVTDYMPALICSLIDQYISWNKRTPIGPGIWHAVKQIYPVNSI
jgi:hypothetical protein